MTSSTSLAWSRYITLKPLARALALPEEEEKISFRLNPMRMQRTTYVYSTSEGLRSSSSINREHWLAAGGSSTD